MRPALGKGLDALISDEAAANIASASTKTGAANTLAIDLIRPNPKQPRRTFAEESLADLVASIKEKGILQPIVVSPTEGGTYEIIAGERRFRGAQRAGLKEVPVVIRTGTEVERFEMSLIENLQREDLNPMDLAEGFKRLQDEFQLTQEAIAQVVGKARTVVANTLRLLGLPGEIQQAIREGKITGGHAKALLAVEDPAAQKALFEQILSDGLTVRHVEGAARDHKKGKTPEHLRAAGYESRPPEIKSLEEDLQRALARKVEIHANEKTHKGSIKLEFYSLDDFDHLVAQLKSAVKT
jgi:ParB family transcriptional regulator, chromosome partitioning protein